MKELEWIKNIYKNTRRLKAKESFNGSANVTHTFTDTMNGIRVYNSGASDLTYTINTISVVVKAGETSQLEFDEFTAVTITTTTAFSAVGLGF